MRGDFMPDSVSKALKTTTEKYTAGITEVARIGDYFGR